MIYEPTMNIFDLIYDKKLINKKIRLIELFAGIGSQAKALQRLNVDFETYKTCEWAFNSIVAYNHIHIKDFADYSEGKSKEELVAYLDGNISTDYNEPCDCTKKPMSWLKQVYNSCIANHNLMNIMKVKGEDLEIVDTDKYEYIMTYSFPCQDLSLAGKRQGMAISQADGGTRSGLLWEVERILTELHNNGKPLPQILLMENVPEVIGSANIKQFHKWLDRLETFGYKTYTEVLNAKDYGIPQNRKRCFAVSILGEYNYNFPTKMKLTKKLKDMLEEQVDEKYYLSKVINPRFAGNYIQYDNSGKGYNSQAERLYFIDGLCPTLPSRNNGDKSQVILAEKKVILIKNATKKGYLEAEEGDGIDISGRMEYHRGTVQKEVSQTLTSAGGNDVGVVVKEYSNKSIEKIIGNIKDLDDVSSTITANPQRATIDNGNLIIVPQWTDKQAKIIRVGKTKSGGERSEILSTEGICSSLTATDYKQPKQILVKDKSLWTDKQVDMITDDGNIKRYVGSDIVDEFKEGQVADISYPTGYGKGNRVYNVCPTLTTAGCTPIVKVKDKNGNEIPLYRETKQLKETIENSELKKGEALNLDLYNRATSPESQTLTDPKHNSQRLFDGLRIRKLTPKECIRLMGFDDKDYEAMKQANLSDSAIYHCAGDSIVVNVLENIFKEMITNE